MPVDFMKISRFSNTMEVMDIIADLRNCLLDFEYPLASTMDDDQLADIFNGPNRCFLVSWIVNLLNEACGGTLQNVTNSEYYLGTLIYEMGLCKKTESIPFMRGELSLTRQLQIIQNMFNSLKCASKSLPKVEILHEEIENLRTLDLNLFPMYGDIKIAKIPPEKENLENLPLPSNDNEINQLTCPEQSRHDIEKFTEKIRQEFPSLKYKISQLLKQKDTEKSEPVNINPRLPEVVKKCDEYMKIINQYLLDLNTIREFNRYDISNSNKNTNDEWRKILRNIYDQFVEVVRYSNLEV